MKKINIVVERLAKRALLMGVIFNLAFINMFGVASAQVGDTDYSNNQNICYTFSYDMRKGSKDSNTNNEVSKLQEALVQLGYLSADPTGYFGTVTYNAVKNFQSAKGLLSSGFVGSYTRNALQSATCNGQYYPYPNNNNINLTPSALNSIVYDQVSDGGTLLGFAFTDISNNFNNVGSSDVSIVNTNLPGLSISINNCNYNSVQSGAVYSTMRSTVYCQSNAAKILNITIGNLSNLSDGTYYYFTIRIYQNGSYADKQYSFTYKKLYNNNNGGQNCTYGYMNGSYGCYYNVTCNSTYDYTRGYYINNCQTNNYNNGGVCIYGYQGGVWGCYYNNGGYYINNNTNQNGTYLNF